MKKTVLSILTLLFAASMAFASGSKEAESENVKLKLWYSISGNNGTFFASQVKSYLESHPEAEIEMTYTGSYSDSNAKISAAKLAGDAPDIIITSASQLFSGEDGIFILEDNDALFNYEDFQSGLLDYAEYNGRIASLPFAISTEVIYYNADLIKKAGIDIESNPPKTWNEFMDMCKSIQAANSGCWGFDTSDSVWLFKSMLFQNGNDIIKNDDGVITPAFQKESGIEVAAFWKKLIDEGVMPSQEHNNAENKFLSGKLAFVAATSNRISKWAGNTHFETGAIEMPFFKKQAVALGGSTCAILTKDKNKAYAALELLSYLLNTQNQSEFALNSGYLPIRKSSLKREDVKAYIASSSLYATAIKQLSYARAYTHFSAMGSMDALLWYALDDIESGKADPAAALKNASLKLIEEMR